ncbi:transcriptional coactivator p15/PC4 family protein [Ruegeria atlantica]|uniref:Transcriptional Coactivator p15 (PC4) n=1 Tax=Ruegeria atlantica TaxID=81569 RepID=A0A0P1E9Q0_9RHOB|nr:transcriptional coactivator p15/PC4 family protein [Ruegeria atlantica]CUH45421.1 Transcriptional Coactivator p15 (PC4) [Ruegeria atlantica]
MALITQIPKNSREEYRVTRDEFQGHDLINIRVYFASEDGEMRPDGQGASFRVSLLPDFMDALSKAEAA